MTAAQEKLINDNYALAPYCVKKYAPLFPTIERDDLLSLAHIGLTDAARTYKPEKGTFANYAVCTIHNRYCTEKTSLACKKRKATIVEMNDRIAVNDGQDIELSIEVRNALKSAMCSADKREGQCFVLYYIHGYSQREIGKMFEISHEQARQLIKRVANRFRMIYELSHSGEAV